MANLFTSWMRMEIKLSFGNHEGIAFSYVIYVTMLLNEFQIAWIYFNS